MARKLATRRRRTPIDRDGKRGGRGLLVSVFARLAAAWVVDVVRDVVREFFDPSNLLG